MSIIDAIIIAIIEGLTELLPVSSTGHMILTSELLGLENSHFLKTFEISIQLGAIMSIVIVYVQRFLKNFEMYKKLTIAFIPTALGGFLAYKIIKEHLFHPIVVAISLIIGGIILIIVDKAVNSRKSDYKELEDISPRRAFMIGLIQCLSMIPGVSRAGATIIGGVFNGLNKRQATEFSFLLAVPTMCAATGYDLLKTPIQFSHNEIILLITGLIIAFIFAWISIKLFLAFVEKFGFTIFGWYRIAIGLLFLIFCL